MSITNELRAYAGSFYLFCNKDVREKLDAIADRIDAEHERVCYDCQREFEDWKFVQDNDFMELPKDADGEYIHIGDEMEGVDKYNSLEKVIGEVITVSFESDGIVDVAIRVWNSDGKSWHRAYLDPNASVYRHYHAPTVEDVLREFFEEVGDGLHILEAVDTQAIIAKYADKLRLVDDGKEQ